MRHPLILWLIKLKLSNLHSDIRQLIKWYSIQQLTIINKHISLQYTKHFKIHLRPCLVVMWEFHFTNRKTEVQRGLVILSGSAAAKSVALGFKCRWSGSKSQAINHISNLIQKYYEWDLRFPLFPEEFHYTILSLLKNVIGSFGTALTQNLILYKSLILNF